MTEFKIPFPLNPAVEIPTFEVLYTEGDQLPELAGCLQDFDLTGFTVELKLQRPADVLTKNAILTDAVNGAFKFTWEVGDLQAGFGQAGLIRLFDASSKSQSLVKFILNVKQLLPL